MTRIAITGHTSGIGKACLDLFSNETVFGYSRSNGWNIDTPNRIIDDVLANQCTVFINNAYNQRYQSDLLEHLYAEWKDKENIIINIGSYITDYPRLERNRDHEPWQYRNDKSHLLKSFRRIALDNSACRVHLISPGPVDTPMIEHISTHKLQANKVAQAIGYAIKYGWLKEMTVYV